jgi:putative transposase
MPHGLRRFQRAEALHFLTFSCFHRLPYLQATYAKDAAAAMLEATRARHKAHIYAYVLMPEHVHLLIDEPPAILLAQFVKAFKQTVSRELRGSREQFWQTRYFDANIRGDDGLSEAIQYIHRNPVKRGLVARPEEYRWNSYRHYMTGERGVVEIESEWTARLRSNVGGGSERQV